MVGFLGAVHDTERQAGADGASPAFLADAMLGRLARWLRLLGFDTAYAGAASDYQIAARARAEGRVVLTRDREMARRRGIRCFLVSSQALEEQLREVVTAFGRPVPEAAPRCPRCNGELAEAERAWVRTRVPAHVFETHARFGRCTVCGRIYWPGSHWQRIVGTLADIADVGQEERASPSENAPEMDG